MLVPEIEMASANVVPLKEQVAVYGFKMKVMKPGVASAKSTNGVVAKSGGWCQAISKKPGGAQAGRKPVRPEQQIAPFEDEPGAAADPTEPPFLPSSSSASGGVDVTLPPENPEVSPQDLVTGDPVHEAGVEEKEAVEPTHPTEARLAVALSQPFGPTQEEIDQHIVSHLQLRIWCPHCVRGRWKSMAHTHFKAEDSHTRPTISIDYGFSIRKPTRKARPEVHCLSWFCVTTNRV